MTTGSFLSVGDKVPSMSTTLMHSPNTPLSLEKRSGLFGTKDGKRPADLRSLVARRFMQMLQVHDRARKEVLATHPTPVR